MIRWCLDRGFVALPKAASLEHIKENFGVLDFSLDEDDLERVARLDKGLRTCWDPTHVA